MKVYLYGKGVYIFDEIFIWPGDMKDAKVYCICGTKKGDRMSRTISEHADKESADRALNDIYEFFKANPSGIY